MTLQVFEVPNSSGSAWLLAALLLPVALGLVLGALFWPRPIRIEVSPDSIRIRGSIYGRVVAKQDIDLSRARVVDLRSEPALVPRLRTNGIGLPNYRVGWFRLRNRERALCFLTDPDAVLYLPTTLNFALLVSLSDPAALLTTLKAPP
jgi:hypothetical protein